MAKYLVTRIKSVLQSAAVEAVDAEAAIEISRKLHRKFWRDVDDKRRKNYRAEKVEYSE